MKVGYLQALAGTRHNLPTLPRDIVFGGRWPVFLNVFPFHLKCIEKFILSEEKSTAELPSM